jgi:hypothetical protein
VPQKGLYDSAWGFNQVSTLGTNTPERCALTRRYAVALGKNTRSARVGGAEGAPDRIY